MVAKKTRRALAAAGLLIFVAHSTSAIEPHVYQPLPDVAFTPVVVPALPLPLLEAQPDPVTILDADIEAAPPRSSVIARPTPPQPTILRVESVSSDGLLSGVASWYCRAGVSRCTNGHPGGFYAAIRRDLLSHRGDKVQVCLGDRCVVVTVIDCLCAGGPGIIDLYSEAYEQLAPLDSGRIKVELSWLP